MKKIILNIKKIIRDNYEKYLLWRCKNHKFQDQNLIKQQNLDNIFKSETINNSYNKDKVLFDNLNIPEMSGGVNPGDQKAIYCLIKYFKPKKILEFGTHLGSSTVSIALAMKDNLDENQIFSTVDIKDVNDIDEQHWKNYGSENSALENIKSIGMKKKVNFFVSDSIKFLRNQTQKYDFIFLDGSHRAKDVYDEINLSLKILNNDGIILLHDYFPKGKNIWKDKDALLGPYLGVKKVKKLNSNIDVKPFIELPWKTKLGTNFTTLALLYRIN